MGPRRSIYEDRCEFFRRYEGDRKEVIIKMGYV